MGETSEIAPTMISIFNLFGRTSLHTRKFFKNKNGNVDKNISFYKKKYEENSANYNSISDNTKITVEKNPIIKDKIIKNKIMLDINSSDEENSINEIDL